ncbi:hypothetical protein YASMINEVIRUS_668 [Yasminevirus sp. GU-2018]|uniref:RING-type domain-containing protein n=1 Tax=Yasminevirus sp. GU-2018 TaxID=2420051 RepID=A0A5K0U8T7_9VIRU|nr:hypothetical protein YASMINEVIRUS_668 [Yasminevirus sp. GU-2018]
MEKLKLILRNAEISIPTSKLVEILEGTINTSTENAKTAKATKSPVKTSAKSPDKMSDRMPSKKQTKRVSIANGSDSEGDDNQTECQDQDQEQDYESNDRPEEGEPGVSDEESQQSDHESDQGNDSDSTEFAHIIVSSALQSASSKGRLKKLASISKIKVLESRDDIAALIDDNITKTVMGALNSKGISLKLTGKMIVATILELFDYIEKRKLDYIYDELSSEMITMLAKKEEPPRVFIHLIVTRPETFGVRFMEEMFLSELSLYMKDVVVARVCEMIMCEIKTQVKPPFTKEHFEKYTKLLSVIMNSKSVSDKCICYILCDMSSFSDTKIDQKYTYPRDKIPVTLNTNTEVTKHIMSLMKEERKNAVATAFISSFNYYSINNMTKNFAVILRELTPHIDEDSVIGLIMMASGGFEYEHTIGNRNRYDGKKLEVMPSEKMINIDVIEIIHEFWPKHLETFIKHNFQRLLCIFSTGMLDSYSNDRSSAKNLIDKIVAYTLYLNDKGILPYDDICKDHLTDKDKNKQLNKQDPCCSCLHDTKWRFTRCGHVICRKCYVTRKYIAKKRYLLPRDICVQCQGVKILKKAPIYRDEEDEISDDE